MSVAILHVAGLPRTQNTLVFRGIIFLCQCAAQRPYVQVPSDLPLPHSGQPAGYTDTQPASCCILAVGPDYERGFYRASGHTEIVPCDGRALRVLLDTSQSAYRPAHVLPVESELRALGAGIRPARFRVREHLYVAVNVQGMPSHVIVRGWPAVRDPVHDNRRGARRVVRKDV